ncbi:MAG: ligand-binding sensor domain-containing protein [Maribacter sp.]|jgi:ligand-binding sensor domain-containing protein
MRNTYLNILICPILLIFTVFTSCNGQEKLKSSKIIKQNKELTFLPEVEPDPQIAEYIRNVFQDKNGNIWFGTNGYGVAHYDGSSVSYFSKAQGFNGVQITGITEDTEKNIWFATDAGIVKYDWSISNKGEKQFTNYSNQPFLIDERFWSIFADSKGNIWAGSASGIVRFDGVLWLPFSLPYPEDVSGTFITKGTSWSISEDRKGNMWFTTNGFGVFKYDPSAKLNGTGQSFTRYSTKDGLTDDSVDNIMEDSKGKYMVWY